MYSGQIHIQINNYLVLADTYFTHHKHYSELIKARQLSDANILSATMFIKAIKNSNFTGILLNINSAKIS